MKVLKEKLISNFEALEILEKEKDLKFFSKRALENLQKFYGEYKVKEMKKLREELESLGFLRENQIVSIMNIIPKDKKDIITALGKDIKNFTEEQIDKIFEITKKYF